MKELDPLVLREIAGYVAPILRSASPAAVSRRVKTYRQDTGEVTGETTIGEALRGLAEVYGLEHAVEGRPRETPCERCGRLVSVIRHPKAHCRTGEGCGVMTCHSCGVACQDKKATRPSAIKSRSGRPWKCNKCTFKAACAYGAATRRSPEAVALGRPLTAAERSRRSYARKKAAKAAAAGGST